MVPRTVAALVATRLDRLTEAERDVVTAGAIVGAVAGYFGAWVDTVTMRITEVFQVMPSFILAAVIVALLGPGLTRVVLVIAILSWPEAARGSSVLSGENGDSQKPTTMAFSSGTSGSSSRTPCWANCLT